MKKIILAYNEDQSSTAAVKNLNYIRSKYQNKISQNNIQFLLVESNDLKDIDPINFFPTLKLISNEESIDIVGYNVDEKNYYEEYFLDFFELRPKQIFFD